MPVTADATSLHVSHNGTDYYFCSAACKEKFLTSPESFVSPHVESALLPLAEGTIYTCPMHPEIRLDHPGACPKCGMTLEPVLPELKAEDHSELDDFRRRFLWTLPFTVLVTFLAMSGPQFDLMDMGVQTWVEMSLTLPVALWAGLPVFQRGVRSVIDRSPNMWTLISLGTGAAFLYSLTATIIPELFPASFLVNGHVAVYYEAVAVIISLTLLGQVLELKARSNTSAAIKALLDLSPKTARRIKTDGSEEEIPLVEVHIGEVLRIRPGEKVPVDGIVVLQESRFMIVPWWSKRTLKPPSMSRNTMSGSLTGMGTGSSLFRACLSRFLTGRSPDGWITDYRLVCVWRHQRTRCECFMREQIIGYYRWENECQIGRREQTQPRPLHPGYRTVSWCMGWVSLIFSECTGE
jgi:YHS domain-containing protein